MHVLVVGGTGMLAGASVWLAEQGHTVSVISRHLWKPTIDATTLNRINAIAIDYRHSTELQHSLDGAISAHGPIECAVFWIHSGAEDAFRTLAEEIALHSKNAWRLFHVRGSAARNHPEPPVVPTDCLYRQVLLGFMAEESGSRWLTHQEISNGVIKAIKNDLIRSVVGTLDPWERRPR